MKNTLLTLKITLIQFLLIFSFSAFGQCNIDALFVEITACEGELFDVSIDFEYEDTGDQFTVTGNGNNYGTFNYSALPITLTSLEADCSTEYEFVVTDVNNNDCSDFVEWGIVCCDENCELWDLELNTSECDGNDFQVTFDFNYQGNTSPTFDWDIVGVSSGTAFFADLPLTVTVFDAVNDVLGFVVQESNDPNCFIETSFENPCIEAECNIISMDFEISPVCENDQIVAEWLIFAENTSETGFDIFVDGQFYTFVEFNGIGPYVFNIDNPGTEFYTLGACDAGNPNCCYSDEWPNPCYTGCSIGELTVDVLDCENNLFDIELNFNYENASNQFTVAGNGVNYGTFLYADLPIILNGLEGDCTTEYEFVVTDVESNDCSNFYELGTICCGGNENCQMTALDYGEVPNCINGFIFAEWFIDGENISEVGYDIFINNDFELFVQYNESNWYGFDFEDPGTEFFTIKACDNDNADCCIEMEFINPCYDGDECNLFDLVIETSECDGGFFEVTFDFEYTGTTNNFFDWEIPGYSSGFAEFSDLPLTVLIENTSMNGFDLFINENDNPNCAIEGSFENPCFETDDCFIGQLNVDVSECDGNMFFVIIDFEYENTSDQFTVNGNGVSYGIFSYADLPITIDGLESDCNLIYEFAVHDINFNDCSSATDIGEVCCEGDCQMTILDYGAIPVCEDGLIVAEWLITGNNISEVGFDIFVNDVFEVFVQYNETDWYDFNIEDPGTEIFTVTACDNDNADCCIDIEVFNPCFEDEECDLFDLVIETSECDGGLINMTFDFEYTGTTNNFFDWEIPGYGNGFAAFNDLPLTITMQNTNASVYDLIINENDNPDCAIDGSFENPCFDPSECFIGELNIDVSDCDDNLFYVVINFEYENTSDEFFVNSNGNNYGPYLYSNLPVTIEGLESNCDVPYEFSVYDSEFNGTCESNANIGIVCCDNNDCFIGELDVDVSECDGNFFFVTINFEYENTSNQFTVAGNGNNYGTYSYADLPIIIDGLESNCDLEYEFVVYDAEFNDCASDIDVGEICCDNNDCFIGALDVDVSECDGNFFFVTINFEYENTSNQFTVAGNGNNYGTYSYADLPIIIDGLESNCDLQYEFVVYDAEFNDCVSDIDVGEICCDNDDCFIGELDVDVSECDGNFFFVTINFEYENTSNQFTVAGNGINYGTYSYADLPIIIDGLESNCDLQYEFVVNDVEFNDCGSGIDIGEICCDSNDCFIGELNVDVSECDGNFFFVTINFEYENTSNQFTVAGNGNNYGTYSYADLPITIDGLESDCDLDYEFVVYDAVFNDCASDIGIGEVCCDGEECDLFELNFDVSGCDGNFFLVEVDFEYIGNTNESFVWEIPGIGSGTDLFSNLPITIEIENSTEPQFTFFANEVENPDCTIVGTFGNPCYDSEECVIDAVSAEVIVCEDDLFDVEINFEYDNVGSTFSIVGNGVDYGTFEYSDLPVVLTGLIADCQLEYEFIIADNDNDQCSDFIELGTICCEDFNQINGLQSQTIIDGETFNITFDIYNTTLKGCNIEVYVDGELYQILSDSESLFTIGPFECGQEDVLEIKMINSCSEAELILMLDLSVITCITDVDITLDSIDLKWDMMQKTLTLEGEVPVSVNVQLINAQGALILAENGVKIGWNKDLNNYPSGLYFVRIVDNNTKSGQGLIKKILIY